MNKRAVGVLGESAAAGVLEKNGWHIIEKNARVGHDEIDLVAENETTLLFCEVKTRSVRTAQADKAGFGRAANAVNGAKRTHLLRGADGYLRAHPTEKSVRFDVVEVYVSEKNGDAVIEEVRLLENAVRRAKKRRAAQETGDGYEAV